MTDLFFYRRLYSPLLLRAFSVYFKPSSQSFSEENALVHAWGLVDIPAAVIKFKETQVPSRDDFRLNPVEMGKIMP